MNEEIYDPDCGACERAQQDYAELERVTDDLAALARQLVRSLRKADPQHALPDKAIDYLKRKGLQGSPLRRYAAVSPEPAFNKGEQDGHVPQETCSD